MYIYGDIVCALGVQNIHMIEFFVSFVLTTVYNFCGIKKKKTLAQIVVNV